jgi:NADH-quinone oxidoreductase subunit J
MVEVVVFAIFALAALGGALVMVSARNPVYSAMGLLLAMFSMAVFYVMNGAHFVAAVQVLLYAGAVMTLFLFVIMLIGVIAAASDAWITGRASGVCTVDCTGTIENISGELFGAWLLPFEATVLLLTIAAVGTVALAQFALKPRLVESGGDEE